MNLNDPTVNDQDEGLDMNHPPLDQDLHAVIMHPVLPDDGLFIELNDLQNNMVEQHLLQLENEVYLMEPALEEVELVQLSDDLHQGMINEPPVAPAPPVNWIVDEIPLDQLVGPGEEGFPEQIEQDHPQGQEINMDVQDEEQDGEQPQLQEQNMQMHIGYMFNPTFGPDPAFLEWERSKNEKAAELLASFFSKANPNSLHIKIPSQWAQFFTVLLLSPNNFSRAKDFLSSNATSCLNLNNETIDFFSATKMSF